MKHCSQQQLEAEDWRFHHHPTEAEAGGPFVLVQMSYAGTNGSPALLFEGTIQNVSRVLSFRICEF